MEILSLQELNGLVRDLIELNLDGTYWVRAELSEVRVSMKGHCFIELVEKDEKNNSLLAKARGVIMSHLFPLVKLNFEQTTGQMFCAGLKVLLQVSVSFSEVYGYSLVVQDIDPTYTMGDLAQRRKEILDRLEREGVAEMNRNLQLPMLVQRIAVISSPTAAGYEDFCKQLENDGGSYRFESRLFPATMQGNTTEKSVIAALDKIASDLQNWDAVAIIRGGGAVSDLSGFDTYDLANNCAQFPLPILTGIGHERDVSVLDLVANQRLKTPTAVAAFLVDRMKEADDRLAELETRLLDACQQNLETERKRLREILRRIDAFGRTFCSRRLLSLSQTKEKLLQLALRKVEIEKMRLTNNKVMLDKCVGLLLENERRRLQMLESSVNAAKPEHIIKLGYSITMKEGKVLKDASLLKTGDTIETRLSRGKVTSIIK